MIEMELGLNPLCFANICSISIFVASDTNCLRICNCLCLQGETRCHDFPISAERKRHKSEGEDLQQQRPTIELRMMEIKSGSSIKIFPSSSFKPISDEEFGPYSHIFEFERNFDQWAVEAWVAHNWAWLCLVIGVSYVLLVFLGILCLLENLTDAQYSQERQQWIVVKGSNCEFPSLSGVQVLPCLVRFLIQEMVIISPKKSC